MNSFILVIHLSPNLFNTLGEVQLMSGYANLADFVNSNIDRIYVSHEKGLKIKWVSGVKGIYPVRHVMLKILNSDQPNREYRYSLRELYKILFRTGGNYKPLK